MSTTVSGRRMQVMIAPNALKHSVRALAAAEAIRRGLTRSGLAADYHLYPLADGGDGTAQVLTRCLGGTFRSAKVSDPLGRPTTAHYGWINDRKLAILEMAEASGIQLLAPEERNPMEASSFGTGQLIQAAIKEGAREIWLGIGGSATVDGGLGALAALGVRTLDAEGSPVAGGGQGLATLHSLQLPDTAPLAQVPVKVLCDVVSPLLGAEGAARVYGPQKGASPPMIKALEHGLTHLSQVVHRHTGHAMSDLPYSGAAGGIGGLLHTVLGAELYSGSAFILEQLGVPDRLPQMDLIVTAEGSLDGQSLQGKAVSHLAVLAQKHRIPVIGLAGRIQNRAELSKQFAALYPINPDWDQNTLQRGEENLCWASEQVGKLVGLRQS